MCMTTSDYQLNGWTNKKLQSTFQSQTCTKKGHGHCLVVCCWSDPLQLFESWWNHYIWGVCSANWWDALKTAMPAASIGQQTGPNSSPWHHPTTLHTTNASKVEWIGLWSFASSAIFTWPLMNRLLLLQAFCREKASTISRMQNMLSRMLSNPKSQIFMLNE